MTDDILELRPASGRLSQCVVGFVRRRDRRGGDVVRILPEPRSSIQAFRADPYWVREDHGRWMQIPRIALWGPRLRPAYGFARRDLDVYAVGLTASGVRALTGRPTASFLEEYAPLHDDRVGEAARRALDGSCGFEEWIVAMEDAIGAACADATPSPIESAVLSLASDGSVAAAAARLSLSERHFRRAFAAEHGAAPKVWQRVMRFNSVLKALHPRPWEAPDEANPLAAYADQAHLIREFCAFAGITPAAYARNKRRLGDRILRSIVVDDVDPPETACRDSPSAAPE